MNKHRKVHLDVEHKPVAPDPVMVQWIGRRREAKDEFKAAWEQFYASLTPERYCELAPHRGHGQGECFVAEMSWSLAFDTPI